MTEEERNKMQDLIVNAYLNGIKDAESQIYKRLDKVIDGIENEAVKTKLKQAFGIPNNKGE